jgi:hypothetical protein
VNFLQPTDMFAVGSDAGSRLWKVELRKFAAETGLAVTVCHRSSVYYEARTSRHPIAARDGLVASAA